MTWEEIIIQIRKDPEYAGLVDNAYFHEDLARNVEKFFISEEFLETREIVEKYCGSSRNKRLLDVGAGNGISSVAFAQLGYQVSSIEPDKSDTVGAGAIRKLKEHFKLQDLEVIDGFGESIPFPDASFDIVYVRQAMHHAAELNKFVKEAARVLKKGGLFLTVRDHVVYDEQDKKLFFETHPLHKFYGGENAFSESEYRAAIYGAGMEVKQMLRHFDSVINYYPVSKVEFYNRMTEHEKNLNRSFQKKAGPFKNSSFLFGLYTRWAEMRAGKLYDERKVPGRMYSFVSIKK